MHENRSIAVVAPDLAQAGAALERAARNARRLSDQTNTPFYVFINEKVVDLRRLEQASSSESAAVDSRAERIPR